MRTSPTAAAPQESGDRSGYWRVHNSVSPVFGDGNVVPALGKLSSGEVSSGDELSLKVRKPYTITKQRERWTEEEHNKFLEALKLYGRAWRRIEEHIGTKTAVQIRSHAQKFFSKLEREASAGGGAVAGATQEIDIPPPRPKRKPSHPYPRKAGGSFSGSTLVAEEDNTCPAAAKPELCAGSNPGEAVLQKPAAAFAPYVVLKPAGVEIPMPAAASESAASLKLFGQTVVVPTAHRPSNDSQAASGGSEEEVKEGIGEISVLESGMSVLEEAVGECNTAAVGDEKLELDKTDAAAGVERHLPGSHDYSQFRHGTATVAHHLAAALSAGMHLHSMADRPPLSIMDFPTLHPARYMAGFPGAPQHPAYSNLESLARIAGLVAPAGVGTAAAAVAFPPSFPPGIWPTLLPGSPATGVPMPMPGRFMPPPAADGSPSPAGQDDAAAVAAATIAAASAWWALQCSVPRGVAHPSVAAIYAVPNCSPPARNLPQQQEGEDSDDGVAEETASGFLRKSSAAKRAERAHRMKEQKARRACLSVPAVCTDSCPSACAASPRPSCPGSYSESSAFPGSLLVGDANNPVKKMGVSQKGVDKTTSGDECRTRARVRSVSGSNSPPAEGRVQPTASSSSGSEADADPAHLGRGRSSDSSGCGNAQQGRRGSCDAGSSDGEEDMGTRQGKDTVEDGSAAAPAAAAGTGTGTGASHSCVLLFRGRDGEEEACSLEKRKYRRKDKGRHDEIPSISATRCIDPDAQAHLQRLSMFRICSTTCSSTGSARLSAVGFVPYQRALTEASGADSKEDGVHRQSEDACNFEEESWRQKRPCTREETVQA